MEAQFGPECDHIRPPLSVGPWERPASTGASVFSSIKWADGPRVLGLLVCKMGLLILMCLTLRAAENRTRGMCGCSAGDGSPQRAPCGFGSALARFRRAGQARREVRWEPSVEKRRRRSRSLRLAPQGAPRASSDPESVWQPRRAAPLALRPSATERGPRAAEGVGGAGQLLDVCLSSCGGSGPAACVEARSQSFLQL